MDGWIETQILVEDIASRKIRQQIRDLADIATSPDPRKEAKAKLAEAKEEAKKGPAPKRAELSELLEAPLPNNNKAALDQLMKLRKQLAHTPVESTLTPSSKARWDLQLAIELMIWATTYSFKTERVFIPESRQTFEESATPLPGDLWNRLIERYPDQAEKGPTPKVTRHNPKDKKTLEAQLRLSNFFHDLYSKIDEENNAMVKRFRVPGPRKQ